MTETQTPLKFPPPIKGILCRILVAPNQIARVSVMDFAADGRRRSAARREIREVLGWVVGGSDEVTVSREQALAYCAERLRLAPVEPSADVGTGEQDGWQLSPGYMRADNLLWCLLHPDQVERRGPQHDPIFRTHAMRDAAAAARLAHEKREIRTKRMPEVLAHIAPVADAATLRYAMRNGADVFGAAVFGAADHSAWGDPTTWSDRCAARRDELLAGIARAQAAIEALDALEAWAAERTPEQIAGLIEATIEQAVAPPADTTPDTTPDTTVAAPAA
jgi:hypothetical protein